MTVYLCDPEKNTKCKKTSCAYKDAAFPCHLTQEKEFARTDENGNPIIAEEFEREGERTV